MKTQANERDYVLGTNDEELQRLGLQHRVWRSTALNCWQQAGITVGSRVLDVGAGPGYATVDLAEIVGSTGIVVAVERSANFLRAAKHTCQDRGFLLVHFHELDLMADPPPGHDYDAAWIRWVASFLPSPATLVEKLASVVRPGGVVVFHEYADYSTWRLAPRNELVEEFVQHVMGCWRATGGEPDIALALPTVLARFGFEVRSAIPRVFCVRPHDHVWRWPSSFLDINLKRLVELGRVDEEWTASVRREIDMAESEPSTWMITSMVLEIVAEQKP